MRYGITVSMGGQLVTCPFTEELTVEHMIARAKIIAGCSHNEFVQLVELDEHGEVLSIVWDSRTSGQS